MSYPGGLGAAAVDATGVQHVPSGVSHAPGGSVARRAGRHGSRPVAV